MSVQTKEAIFAEIKRHELALRRFGVKRFGHFGSFLRGSQTSQSDVDFLVEFETGQKSSDNFMNLALYLEDLFGRKVDLVTRESLSRHFGPKIMEEVEDALTAS
jgi:predicted nucleotidyltransferase